MPPRPPPSDSEPTPSFLEVAAARAPSAPEQREIIERYTARLLGFARQRLPAAVRRRVDPEDLVQSVYRSFFQRLRDGRFSFADSGDLWRLLAAMTFQRVTKSIRFHQQQRRDVRREAPLTHSTAGSSDEHVATAPEPGPADVALLFESLETLFARLPAKYREIAILQLHGRSVDEIADVVRRSRRTVFRALAELEALAATLLRESVE